MSSSSEKQEKLRAQMAVLQAELDAEMSREEEARKRTRDVRVAATPSPKKRKLSHPTAATNAPRLSAPVFKRPAEIKKHSDLLAAAVRPSQMAAALEQFNASKTEVTIEPPTRSESFIRPNVNPAKFTLLVLENSAAPLNRNEDLTVIENLELGPIEHAPPFDDPSFERYEPNSRINLRSRELSHEDLQEHLRGRYYISPSRLYSVARLTPNRQAYEVPVPGDWVTIAVIAERGQISVSRANSKADVSGDDTTDDDQKSKNDQPAREAHRKAQDKDKSSKKKPPPKKSSGRKYLTLRLVDFGHRGSDSHSSKAVIKGDALLNMILFEADSYSTIRNSDGLADRVYRGGSGGAFEACARFREGTVIAVMNAKILKPFQRGTDKPHPTDNVLALTPENASSIAIIGQSKDLGKCHALKRDGKQCGSWCDLRVSEVCEYHIQRAIQSRRASRPEFSAGTSGMTSTPRAAHGSATPNAAKKWGLLPRAGLNPSATKASASLGGGTTYVLPGQVISSSSSSRSGPEYVGEAMGREKHERRKRKRELQAQELELQRLLEKDGGKSEGAKVLVKAREAIHGKPVRSTTKGKDKEGANGDDSLPQRRVFSATAIQRIGFDPTAKRGDRPRDDDKILQVLNELQSSKPKIELGPRPGPKVRSGVSVSAALRSASSAQRKEGPKPVEAEPSPSTSLPPDSPHVDSDDELEIV